MWPLAIQFDDADHPMKASVDTLLQLTPGVSTLQEMYNSVGYPRKRKDFPDSVALLYPSLWVKSPHVIILDGKSGKVMVVAIENVSKPIFSLSHLKQVYGEPTVAYSDTRDYYLFPNTGIAAIVYNDKIEYIQLLPKNITVDEYQKHQGYWQQTFSFVP